MNRENSYLCEEAFSLIKQVLPPDFSGMLFASAEIAIFTKELQE